MKTIAIICAGWLVLAVAAAAQTEMPKPGPEHKKLDMFAGSWTLEGDMKPARWVRVERRRKTRNASGWKAGSSSFAIPTLRRRWGMGREFLLWDIPPTTRSIPTANSTVGGNSTTPRARWMATPGHGLTTKR